MKGFFLIALKFWQKMFLKRELVSEDVLAKYIFKLKDVRADGSVRPSNLKPRKGEKLSLFEVGDFGHDGICKYGHDHVDNREKKRIHIGYGKFFHESFSRLGLITIYDNKPKRHVSVEFPENPEQRRELSKALADEFIEINSGSDKKYFLECVSAENT